MPPVKERKAIAAALKELATLMELAGANTFKVRAHENAARALETGDIDVAGEVEAGTLGERKGFGESMVQKVTQMVREGKIDELEELRDSTPEGLVEMLGIPGFGPKKIRAVHDELEIETVADLKTACEEGRLRELKGFSEKTETNILEGIAFMQTQSGQTRWHEAWERAQAIVEALRKKRTIRRIDVAGSLRRRKEVVKDVDIVASSASPEKAMEAFVGLPGVEDVIAHGETKSSVRLEGGLAVDLRVVEDSQFPAALAHFTGSKEHNVAMRSRAQREFGIRISEYGLFDKEDSLIECEDEEALYGALELDWVPPELREDQGEIEAAEKRELPELLETRDLRGIIHMHTTYSDGRESLQTMAAACEERGYAWMGISDHSVTAAYAGGMKPDMVKRQFEEIDAWNRKSGKGKIRIFKGIEVDILGDGSIDYDEEIWEMSDFLIASVHSQFTMPEKKMTERVCRAMENPFVTILGHPTGRLLLQRDGYEIDLESIIEKAAETGTLIEVNANPRRLDLDWRWVKRARDAGVMIAIGPDAHSVPMLDDTALGVGIARKGWLRKGDVLNCLTAKQAEAVFKATRKG